MQVAIMTIPEKKEQKFLSKIERKHEPVSKRITSVEEKVLTLDKKKGR